MAGKTAITAKRMTGLHVERLARKVGRHGMGDGLLMQVRAPGRASWVWRYQRHGRRREMGFGTWPEISLVMARERLFAAKRAPADGREPRSERQAAGRPAERAST